MYIRRAQRDSLALIFVRKYLLLPLIICIKRQHVTLRQTESSGKDRELLWRKALEKSSNRNRFSLRVYWDFAALLCISNEADQGEKVNCCHAQGVCVGERLEEFLHVIDAENRSLNDTFLLVDCQSGVLQGVAFADGKGTGGESNNAGCTVCPLTLMLYNMLYVKLSKTCEN